MLTENPFELILLRLEHIQSTINDLSVKVVPGVLPIVETEQDRLINLPEAAQLIKKPVGTVRYYIHHRNLPAKKIGKSFIIKYSDLLTWLETFSEEGQETSNVGIDQMIKNRKRYSKKLN